MVPQELSPAGPALLIVAGPTGAGKGELGRFLAGRLGGEIVCADSRKIYRGLDVGTGKPGPAERAALPHHLLDLVEPGEPFSAARYAALAEAAVRDIAARGRLPVVVGGTGLYLRALLFGMIDTPPRDEALRARLLAEERRAPGWLHARLGEVDPASAGRLAPGDHLRLVRALEVHALTGRRLSALQAEHGFRRARHPYLALAPDWPQPELERRLEARVRAMLAAGWLAEVAALRDRHPGRGLEVLGYRELAAQLDGALEPARAREAICRAHRRYARYQRGLFRRFPGLQWLPAPVDREAALTRVRAFLAQWNV